MKITKKIKNQINWRARVEAWKASGLPMSRYCKQHGLVAHQLGYYKRKYEAPKSLKKTSSSSFVRVVVPTKPILLPETDSVIIRLSNGHAIEGVSKNNLHIVSSLIEALS